MRTRELPRLCRNLTQSSPWTLTTSNPLPFDSDSNGTYSNGTYRFNLGIIDYRTTWHKVKPYSVLSVESSISSTSSHVGSWLSELGQLPNEYRFVALLQRKRKVTAAQFVRWAAWVVAKWIRETQPAEATLLGEPFLDALAAIKAPAWTAAIYKAARRDGLLHYTTPYSERDITPQERERLRRFELLEVDPDGEAGDGHADDLALEQLRNHNEKETLDQSSGDFEGAQQEADNFASDQVIAQVKRQIQKPEANEDLRKMEEKREKDEDERLERQIGRFLSKANNVLDVIIERTAFTFGRAAAKHARLDFDQAAAEGKCVMPQTRLWVYQNHTREPSPVQSRLCGFVCPAAADLVRTQWADTRQYYLAFAVALVFIDLEYMLRMMPPEIQQGGRADRSDEHRAQQAATIVRFPEAFTPNGASSFIRQVYKWRKEPFRKLTNGRRQPLECGKTCALVKIIIFSSLDNLPSTWSQRAVFHWLRRTDIAGLRAALSMLSSF